MPNSSIPYPLSFPAPKALAFDVFGTVVDWRGSIAREAAAVGAARGIEADWEAFADAWRAGYAPAMQRVRAGELPWLRIDALHRLILDDIRPRFGLGGLPQAECGQLNRAWHRLDPWPDTVAGLARLKRRFVITTLSNGNVSLLTNMAKRAGLPWDCVISAELFRHYKPDPETYLGCADLLDIAPAELMLVACHPGDLRAARAAGLRTGYVARPLENGAAAKPESVAEGDFDIVATDFNDLAQRLGV
jgi:2-haloacid dehalogenase